MCDRCIAKNKDEECSVWKANLMGYQNLCDGCHNDVKALLAEWMALGKQISEESLETAMVKHRSQL